MAKSLIKICGIKDPDLAVATVKAGADYIGIIFHPNSPRYVELEQAAKIATAALNAGGIPVAVFVNQNAAEMQTICETCNIKTVQLHGDITRQNHYLLPQDYQRIYVQIDLPDMEDNNLRLLDKERDFLLLDKPRLEMQVSDQVPIHANKNSHTISNDMHSLPFRWFLAGKLTTHNVPTAIKIMQPDGVDVSSGVETSPGNKDFNLIKNFIGAVRVNQ